MGKNTSLIASQTAATYSIVCPLAEERGKATVAKFVLPGWLPCVPLADPLPEPGSSIRLAILQQLVTFYCSHVLPRISQGAC